MFLSAELLAGCTPFKIWTCLVVMKFTAFPTALGSLQSFDVSGYSNVDVLPINIEDLSSLTYLGLYKCRKLCNISESLRKLITRGLGVKTYDYCQEVEEIIQAMYEDPDISSFDDDV